MTFILCWIALAPVSLLVLKLLDGRQPDAGQDRGEEFGR